MAPVQQQPGQKGQQQQQSDSLRKATLPGFPPLLLPH